MTYIRRNEAFQAAYGAVLDIALRPDTETARVALVHKLIRGEMTVFAQMAPEAA